MILKNNPFFILDVSDTETRREIISKAEEMSFFGDPDQCNQAQSVLLNPAKRLEAEVSWFPGIEDSITKSNLRKCIDEGREIPEEDLRPLAKLNAVLFNIGIQSLDNNSIQERVKLLDEIYDSIDAVDVLDDINSARRKAGIAETTLSDIEDALNEKREEIRRIIHEKLQTFSENTYVEIVNEIAERFINNDYYDQGVVIDDVINQYEVQMQTVLEEKTESVLQLAKEIEITRDTNQRNAKVAALIRGLKEWDRYAQPLQLKARAEGQMHSISEHLARDVRNTSITIHNDFEDVDNATKIFEALKTVFAELPEFMSIITEDAEVLEKNKQFQKALGEYALQRQEAEEKVETRATIIKWVIRLAIIAAIIALPSMCHDGGSSNDSSSYDDSYYEEDYDTNDEDYSDEEIEEETEATTEEKKYKEKDMPETGYVFNNTCDSRPTYILIKNESDDAYLVHVSGSDDGEELDGFIAPNSTGQIYVPTGLCTLSYSHGPKWYGEKHKFGDDEVYDGFNMENFDSEHYYSITVPFKD